MENTAAVPPARCKDGNSGNAVFALFAAFGLPQEPEFLLRANSATARARGYSPRRSGKERRPPQENATRVARLENCAPRRREKLPPSAS
jgi:hypothetical protein